MSPIFSTMELKSMQCIPNATCTRVNLSKLNYDLLWVIFMINTKSYGGIRASTCDYDPVNHPLNIARWSSQVCREWRKIIVESPLIWANVIELGLLTQKTDYWRNEVIQRTGKASLDISGWVDWDNDISLAFLNLLLRKHWKRIRSLDVEFRNAPDDFKSPRKILHLHTPNPQHICVWSRLPTNDNPNTKLEEFFQEDRRILFPIMSPDFPWIPQLHSLIIGNQSLTNGLLSLLASMPRLQHLEASSMDFVHQSCLREIALPHLKYLGIGNNFATNLALLKSIVPSPRCALQFSSHDVDSENITNNQGAIAVFGVILKRYFTRHFGSSQISNVKLALGPNHFSFGTGNSKGDSHTQSFNVSVRLGQSMPLSIYLSFLAILSSFQLSSATMLQIHLSKFPGYKSLSRPLLDFIWACPGVEVIGVNETSAKVLCDIMNAQPTIFPALHTLAASSKDEYSKYKDVNKYAEIMLSFLASRRKAKLPIKVLDLATCNPSQSVVSEYWDSYSVIVRKKCVGCVVKGPLKGIRQLCPGCSIADILDASSKSSTMRFFRGGNFFSKRFLALRKGFKFEQRINGRQDLDTC